MYSEILRLSVIVSFFLVFCALIGSGLLNLLLPRQTRNGEGINRHLAWFLSISMGLVMVMTMLFTLGLAGWLNLYGVAAAGVIILLAFIPAMPRIETILRPAWNTNDAVAIVAFFAATLLSCLHAPGLFDDTMYHLPLARWYLRHEAIIINEFVRFPLFPQNMDILMTLGMMLAGDLGAQAFAALPAFVIAIGLLGMSRRLTGSILLGVFAAVLLFLLKPIESTLGYAYVDNGLALFCWAAIVAAVLWVNSEWRQRLHGWLIVAGILAGCAAGTKYFGAIFLSILFAYLLLICRDWKSAVIFGAVAVTTGSWWYIRSFLISGDPIHPAGGNLFGHYLWNAADLLYQKRGIATPRDVAPGTSNLIGALQSIGIGSWQSAGVLPWIVAAVSLVFPKLPASIRLFQFIFFTYLAFWFFVAPRPRYIAPAYVVGMLLSCYAVYQIYSLTLSKWIANKFPQFVQNILVFGLVALVMAPLVSGRYTKAKIDMMGYQTSLDNQEGYRLFAKANSLIPGYGDRILQLGFENAKYFFDGTAIGDWFGPARYSDVIECGKDKCKPGCGQHGCDLLTPPERMKFVMEHFDVRMLVISKKNFSMVYDKQISLQYFDLVMEDQFGILLVLKPTTLKP